MAKTTPMKLLELMVLKNDIKRVIEYLGKKEIFQFQEKIDLQEEENIFQMDNDTPENHANYVYEKLQTACGVLNITGQEDFFSQASLPLDSDDKLAFDIFTKTSDLYSRELKAEENKKQAEDALAEAKAFGNLKTDFSQLGHLSFINLKIGKIDPDVLQKLTLAVGNQGAIIPLGDDNTRILAVSSKKNRFSLDAVLKKFGFVEMEVPPNFKGIPDEMLFGLEEEVKKKSEELKNVIEEKNNYAETHREIILKLLCSFSVAAQVQEVENSLESTQLVYRMTGWIPSNKAHEIMKGLDNLTEGRIAIRQYNPDEVETVKNGSEKVPVKLTHGKFVNSFERMILSYGSPEYGSIDPTPFVAFFFTLLFGIMFGDVGQGLVFVLAGILLSTNVIKWFPTWNKFGPIFIAIGCSSMVMGLLTGEFFCNHHVLEPFALWVTGFFGEPHAPILHMMPSSETIGKMFLFFLFTIGIGFIINSIGLIINIINNFNFRRYGKAIFGKTGLCGALFFWYVVFMVARIFLLKTGIIPVDYVILSITLLGVFFAEPLERLVDGHKPILENGLLSAIIAGVVEIIEVVSTYISNSVSFLRVGAFAMAHAVLAYIISTMSSMIPNPLGAIGISIIGNCIVIVLEGMIVAIQVIRLQYYEFFSKFFGEIGREFKPFKFTIR